jgi:ribosome maturation factor RimP
LFEGRETVEVEAMVRPVVEAAGLELVEATLLRERGRRVVRVTVDRDGGIDLDTIGEVSGRIGRRLDLEGFDPGPYDLEVSSPGLERPLRGPRDFERRVGQRVKVRTAQPIEGSRTHVGSIASADEHAVRIATEAGEREIRYEDMTSARTVFEWGSAERRGGKR